MSFGMTEKGTQDLNAYLLSQMLLHTNRVHYLSCATTEAYAVLISTLHYHPFGKHILFAQLGVQKVPCDSAITENNS